MDKLCSGNPVFVIHEKEKIAPKGRRRMIVPIKDRDEKKQICRKVLEALPEWFGIEESREEYIADCGEQDFFAAFKGEEPVGFLCLKKTGKDTVEIAVMGILKPCQHQGLGRELFFAAKEAAAAKGFSFIQVKTVQKGRYKEYDATNDFYISLGFKELEVFPTLWDEWNPCQVYVMAL